MSTMHFTVWRTSPRRIIVQDKETNSEERKPGLGQKHKMARTPEGKLVTDGSKKTRPADQASRNHSPDGSPSWWASGPSPLKNPWTRPEFWNSVFWSDGTKLEVLGHMDVAGGRSSSS